MKEVEILVQVLDFKVGKELTTGKPELMLKKLGKFTSPQTP